MSNSFSPYQVLPVSVENTSTRRDKRLNQKKTVYVIYYPALDGTGYRWEVDTGSKSSDISGWPDCPTASWCYALRDG